MANQLLGPNLHLTAWPESAWGTKPMSPDYFFLPVEDYGVKLTGERRTNRPYLGQRARKHGRRFRGMPAGQIRGALHGYHPSALGYSLAQFILNQAYTAPTDNDLPSFGVEFAQGPNVANKQHNGLRCNSLTLTGSEQSGRVEYTLDVMGKDEVAVAAAQTIPNDLEKLVDFDFQDITLTFDGTEVDPADFTLTRNNNLKPKYLTGRSPSHLKAAGADDTFACTIIKNSSSYDALARLFTPGSEHEALIVLTLLGLHNATTSSDDYTQVTITMARAQLIDPDDQYALEDYTMTTLNFELLKPDSATAAIALAYDTA